MPRAARSHPRSGVRTSGQAQLKRTAPAGTVQVRACSRAVFYCKATLFNRSLASGPERWRPALAQGILVGIGLRRSWIRAAGACIAGWLMGSSRFRYSGVIGAGDARDA